ncbi:efflux RND transporter periplasmic adaptor subunit, partial [Microbacteriaceae bacterium K1510]|nr:efflux RND transporter periplasmic adaptor subunit [Microbacteriaceae bacterium K1510]
QTEDARAKADLTVLKTPITGQIASLQIRENQEVEANEVIGFVRAATASASPGTRVPLIAPASGRVLRMGVQEGEVVTSGQNLLAIADLETTYVEARLTETEVSRVRIGQTVNVSLDTAAGKTVTGVVSMIEGVTQQ